MRGHACGHAGQRRGSTRPWSSILKRVLVEETAAVATTSATAVIKNASNRERPDGSDNEGFPSARSSRAFAYNMMGAMNIDALPVQAPVQTGLRLSLTGMATATAWARVEGRVHCPSDVLFGAALGNFLGHCLQQAFLGKSR